MLAKEIRREALRNTSHGVSRPLLCALVFATLAGAVAALDARLLVEANNRLADWRDSGAAVMIADAGPESIDGQVCESLSSIAGITYSGALRRVPEGLTLDALPSFPVPLYEVTPGFAALVTSTARGTDGGPAAPGALASGGVILSEDLATRLGRSPGGVASAGIPASILDVLPEPDDGRQPTLSGAALVQVPASGSFEACWVEVWPPDEGIAALARSSARLGAAEHVSLAQLNPTRGTTLDAIAPYTDRLTRGAPVVGALIGMGIGWASVRTRRLELASALHARVSRRALRLITLLEASIWSLVGLSLVAPVVWFAATTNHAMSATSALWPPVAAPLSAALGVHVGVLLAFAATREEHLFDYFRNR